MTRNGYRRNLADLLINFPIIMKMGHIALRFLQPKFTIGAVGVVRNDAGQILLVEHVFHPLAPWGLPGGWINRNESPAECVKREIREELELDIIVEQVLLIAPTIPRHMDFAYLCRANGQIGNMSNELLAYHWFEPDKIRELKLLSFHRQAIMTYLENHQSPENPNLKL